MRIQQTPMKRLKPQIPNHPPIITTPSIPKPTTVLKHNAIEFVRL
jgi:hypothetical protein